MVKHRRGLVRSAVALIWLVAGTSCSGVQHNQGAWACDHSTADDLARGATSLVLVTPLRRGTADSAGEPANAAFVRLDRTVSGVSPGNSFAVVNPDIVDVNGLSTMRVGVHYLAYLKPRIDRDGAQVKNGWLSVGGPVGIWRQTSPGTFESLWTDPAMAQAGLQTSPNCRGRPGRSLR